MNRSQVSRSSSQSSFTNAKLKRKLSGKKPRKIIDDLKVEKDSLLMSDIQRLEDAI